MQSGRYLLGAVIGKGGFGITYAAWDTLFQMSVAIKEYFPAGYADRDNTLDDAVLVKDENRAVFEMGRWLFSREARILGTLQNVKSVVNVRDWFEQNGTEYIVMEYVYGVTIDQYVREQNVNLEKLFSMLRELVDGLVIIHKAGVLHRDIAPNNLMVLEDGSVKLIDFGAAAVVESRKEGRDQTVMLNRRFAAPEQYDKDREQGAWTDVYGLSATLYTLLTGEELCTASERLSNDTMTSLRKKGIRMKKWQEKAIMGGLHLNPEKRIRSMEEFRAALYHLPASEESRRRKRRIRRAVCVGSGAFVLMLLAGINFTVGLPLGEGLLYSLFSDGIHIVGELAPREERVLPETRLGLPVTSIDALAFSGDKELVKLEIPGSIQAIEEKAFYSCPSLYEVVVKDGAEEIREYAFAKCESLRSISLPNSLMLLAENAFEGDSCFLTIWGTEGLIPFKAKRAQTAFSARYDYEIADNDSGGVTLLGYSGDAADFIIPSVIDGKKVTELVWGSEKTQGIQIPETAVRIAFPEYLSEVPQNSGYTTSDRCEIQEAALNPYLKSIGEKAFYAWNLEEIELPQGVEAIGDFAFAETNIREILLPDTARSVGNGAFASTKIASVIIPQTVQSWGSDVFMGCERLEEITFSEGIREIPSGMFSRCTFLEVLELPDSLRRISERAFEGCSKLTEVIIPEGLEAIGERAFAGCAALRYLELPASITEISPTAFEGCSESLVLGVTAGTEAERFAKDKGLRYQEAGL